MRQAVDAEEQVPVVGGKEWGGRGSAVTVDDLERVSKQIKAEDLLGVDMEDIEQVSSVELATAMSSMTPDRLREIFSLFEQNPKLLAEVVQSATSQHITEAAACLTPELREMGTSFWSSAPYMVTSVYPFEKDASLATHVTMEKASVEIRATLEARRALRASPAKHSPPARQPVRPRNEPSTLTPLELKQQRLLQHQKENRNQGQFFSFGVQSIPDMMSLPSLPSLPGEDDQLDD
eukprot:TRINITY_DN9982_c0_g1_i1.p1 TRINITY_DN9982_c0_g1~~TRINITY_DN9982_c0_g1_i1.p1  ORF type:complete len:256 (+),score=52.75 TRINITY_DN9982_c0_g1_i1:64-768(+)